MREKSAGQREYKMRDSIATTARIHDERNADDVLYQMFTHRNSK